MAFASRGANDMRTLEERFAEVEYGWDAGDAAKLNRFVRDRQAAERLRDSQRLDGSWAEVDVSDASRSSWRPAVGHLRSRVLSLAREYRASKDPSMAAAVKRGLDWWINAKLVCSNWWWNEIGAPQDFALAAIFIAPELTDAERGRYAEYLKCSQIRMTGQNRVWLARIVLMRGVINQDTAMVDSAVRAIRGELRVSSGNDGVMPDWCFRQHGPQLQFGNYGLSYVLNMSRLARILATTKWEMPQENADVLRNLVENGFLWTVWNGHMDAAVMGRQLTPGASLLKADAVALTRAQCEAIGWKFASVDPRGFRFFPKGAYAVWRQDGWMASVKMHTREVLETETWINNENTLGGHLADGSLWMYSTGGEYDDVFPLWRNWRLIPGITSYRDRQPVVRGYSEGPGSNELNEMSAKSDESGATVDFAIRRDGLFARKRWRFTSEGVEATGSEISSSASDSRVVTCVEHCLAAPNAKVFPYANGSIRFVNGCFEYEIFAPESAVSVVIEEREGTWKGVHPNYADKSRRGRVLCAVVDHGVSPKGASYRYRITRAKF